jgi:hypothetical protein
MAEGYDCEVSDMEGPGLLDMKPSITIDDTPDEFSVILPTGLFRPKLIGVCLILAFICFEEGSSAYAAAGRFDRVGSLLAAFFCLMAAYGLLKCLRVLGTQERLCCSVKRFTLQRALYGRTRQLLDVPPEDVADLRYTGLTTSKFGTSMGFRCSVSKRRLEFFEGLKSVEADRILKRLNGFNVHIESDPGMPMLVEMELARRARW